MNDESKTLEAAEPPVSRAGPSLIAAHTVYETQDLVVDGCKEALDGFSESELAALAEHIGVENDGWLGKFVREYLNAWREIGDRP